MAPGSPPDDPVRGLGPSSTPPRMHQSGASCFLLILLSGRLRVWCFGAFFFPRAHRRCSFPAPPAPLSLAPCPVPRFVVCCARFPGSRHPVAVVAWHLSSCPGCGRRRASLACLVAPRWCAAPRPVRSLSVLRSAFPSPWCLPPSPTPGAVAPGFTGWLRGARGGRPRTGLIVPAAGPCRGKGAGRAPRRTRSGPRDGVVPGGSLRLRSWAACAAVVWRLWTRSLTRPVSRTVRLATGDSAGAPGLFRVDADTAPFGSENATPGSRACVRVRALLGRFGRAGLPGAFWCASPFLWPFLVRSLLVRPPLGWGCPVCGCCWFFFFLLLVPFPPLVAPSLCPALRVFRPRVPWALASCSPPPFFLAHPPPPVVPRVSCFPVSSGLCAPPPFFFFFVSFFLFFLFPFFFSPVGAGLCVLGRRVCPCVPQWCCPRRCSVCAGWCCVVFAVGPGCPVLSPGGSWCRASVVLSLSGRVARRPVVRRVASWCSAALCCVLLRCAVVWWCDVVLCRLFASLPAPIVCFLPPRVCCVCSGVSCCVFPVLCALCGAVLRCAGALSLCCARRLCFFWWVVLLVPGVAAFCWGSAGGSGCPALSFGGVCRLWCPCVVWPSLGVFPVASCSPVLCPVALCCLVVLCCAALSSFLFFFSLLVALVSCCPRLVLGSGPVPGCFFFCALPVRCCAGVPASLLSVRCSLALAGLAGVLCCCLLCLCVCCWAWLSSVISWWVVVAPGVVSRWRAVACPWVLCCAVLRRVVPPGVALLCAVLLPFAPFGAAARCVVSWGAVRRLGVLCLLAPCFVLSPRAVCVLLWRVAAWCCSPLCFVPCAPWGVVLCVSCRLRPVRCCCVARSPSVPCSPVLRPVVLCCRVVPWCPVRAPCWVCFLRGFGCTYLQNRCKIS